MAASNWSSTVTCFYTRCPCVCERQCLLACSLSRSLTLGLCLLERSQGKRELLTSSSEEWVKRQEWLRCWSHAGCSEVCCCRFSLFLYAFHFPCSFALHYFCQCSAFFILLFLFCLVADFIPPHCLGLISSQIWLFLIMHSPLLMTLTFKPVSEIKSW